jgi:transposase
MRRHQWRLSDEQRINLDHYLEKFPVLKAMYQVKQKLNQFLLLKTLNRKKAKRKLPGFLKLIKQLSESPLNKLANTLTSWLEPIVAMWRFSKSNGITEGVHTKMEMMTRRAFGFRNFENYRLRVLTHCGWNGIINRV